MFKERYLVFKDGEGLGGRAKDFLSRVAKPYVDVAEGVSEKAKKIREDRKKLSGKILDNLEIDEDISRVAREAIQKVSGLSPEDAQKILDDDTNPYSIWLMDSVQEGANSFELRADGPQVEHVRRLLGWEKIYKQLARVIASFNQGERAKSECNFETYRDAIFDAVKNGHFSYPMFENWIMLESHGSPGGLDVNFKMMIELEKASGRDSSYLEDWFKDYQLAESKKKDGHGESLWDAMGSEEKNRYEVSNEEIDALVKRSNMEVGSYYDGDGNPLPPEEVDRIQEEERRFAEESQALEEARKEFFSEEEAKYDSMVKEVADPKSMSDGQFKSFKSDVSGVMDKIAEKEPALAELNDRFKKEVIPGVQQMLDDGASREDVDSYIRKWAEASGASGVYENFESAKEDGDYKGAAGGGLWESFLTDIIETMKKRGLKPDKIDKSDW